MESSGESMSTDEWTDRQVEGEIEHQTDRHMNKRTGVQIKYTWYVIKV